MILGESSWNDFPSRRSATELEGVLKPAAGGPLPPAESPARGNSPAWIFVNNSKSTECCDGKCRFSDACRTTLFLREVTAATVTMGYSAVTTGENSPMHVVARRSGEGSFKEDAASCIDQLYRVAYHLTKRKHDAEDLVQETYLRAISNYGQFEPGTNLKAWLTRILYNLFVNRYHHDKKTVSIDERVTDAETSWLDTMESSARGPETEFLQTELKDRLKEALESLSEEFATPVVLVDIGGFFYAEAAEILSCPVGTVRSRLFRARSALASKLREYVRDQR